MLFKLVNNTVMVLAAFYVAEGTGIIEKGKYFPTLPRMEASASDPRAWLGAAKWGVGHLTTLARSNEVTAPVADVRNLSLENVTTFRQRLEEKRDSTIQNFTEAYNNS